MSEDIRIEVEFARMGQGVAEDAFQINGADLVVPNQENEIIQITITASI